MKLMTGTRIVPSIYIVVEVAALLAKNGLKIGSVHVTRSPLFSLIEASVAV